MLRIVKTENGLLKGIMGADPRVTAFKGVPFAAPPVGEKRWKAPHPAKNWDGVREAFEFGPISMQDTPGLGNDVYCREWHVDPDIPMSEDCLYLNIWTSAKYTEEKLPVLLWYFGGGFQWGYTAEMEFDGERLARRGVVVVTAGYRLGAFGFLSHPEITKENPMAPGNFGFLDQQAALRWVKRNIRAFGGDPEHITIAGQSAGGGSVMAQLTCGQNDKDICGAAIFSGIIRRTDQEDHPLRAISLSEAEERGKDFFAFLGVSNLEEARALDPFFLRDQYGIYVLNHPRMFPIIDGCFCKEDPIARFIHGDRAQVPVLAGNTDDEFRENGINSVEKAVKTTFLDAQAEHPESRDMFYYRFAADIPGWDHEGNFHSCDLWFFFESLGKCWRPFKGRHFDLARTMCDYFANFIKTGNPNGTGWDGTMLPAWNPYTDKDRCEMVFNSQGVLAQKEKPGFGRRLAFNPYLPSYEYVPDGEPYVFDGRVYVYGSHDLYDAETFCMGDYVCWSAPVDDLGSWRYEGIIYPKKEDPMNQDGHMCLYAPDVTVGPDGRYYLYYVLDKVSVVSVAVCDTPAGRYRFYGYVHYADGTRLGEREGDQPQFDPGVLTEGDRTFLYTGFCGHGDPTRSGAMMTVLDSDMLTVTEDPIIVVPGAMYSSGTGFEGHAYFEAASIRKVGKKYCFVYSSEVMHELCCAFSEDPRGPFSYGGVLISNCDLHISSYKAAEISAAYGANNHGSVIQINGKWYVFYHRHTNGTWYSRQGCAEPLVLRPNGSFEQAEMTSCGLNGCILPDEGEYPAYIACNLFTEKHAVYVEPGAPRVVQEGGEGQYPSAHIRGITDGTTIGFKYFDCHNITGLSIRTRAYADGCFEIKCRPDGEVLGVIHVKGENIWTTGVCHFVKGSPFPEGKQALFLTFKGTGSSSLCSFEFLHE